MDASSATLAKAQSGLNLIQEAILDYLESNPQGVTHAEIVRQLHLESDFEGRQKNYLSWSVIGLLINAGKVRYELKGRTRIYFKKT